MDILKGELGKPDFSFTNRVKNITFRSGRFAIAKGIWEGKNK